jgi:hypothetical protein
MTSADGEWAVASNIVRHAVETMDRASIPSAPGIYIWFRSGEPVYIGEARGRRGLRQRLRAHLTTGVDLSRSTLRASVAVAELGLERAEARRRPSVMTTRQVEVVNNWLAGCEIGWIECSTGTDAHNLEAALRSEWLPPLNRL